MAKGESYDFFVDIEDSITQEVGEKLIAGLRELGVGLVGDSLLFSQQVAPTATNREGIIYYLNKKPQLILLVPWFPRKLKDLDLICSKVSHF